MADYSRLTEIFEKLISFPTITGDHDAMGICLDYIEDVLAPTGMYVTRQTSNGFESLVATSRRTKRSKLLLQAHLDVVAALPEQFILRQQDGNIFGRGVFDMKFAAACYLRAAEVLASDIERYDFGIMFTSDEEVGGANGVGHLLEQGYGARVCLLPDGADDWRIETTAKGAWIVDVKATGKSSHGSRPWEGENAAEKLMSFLHEARRLTENEPPTGASLVVSRLHAGESINQVPDATTATLDIRTPSAAKHAEIKQRLGGLAQWHQVILEPLVEIQPMVLDVNIEQVRLWEQAVNEIRGEINDDYMFSFGASDARYFAAKGIPTIVTRPAGGSQHAPDEWISEQGFYEFYACVKRYVEVAGVRSASPVRN